MYMSLYQEFETETPNQFRSELMILFKRDPALREKVKQKGPFSVKKSAVNTFNLDFWLYGVSCHV